MKNTIAENLVLIKTFLNIKLQGGKGKLEQVMDQIAHISALNHFFITMLILITMVLVSRTVVAGTKYSSILIIVVFGLAMGFLLVKSQMATPGLAEFPMVVLASKTTVIALIASFFVGGQEIKKIFCKEDLKVDDIMIPSKDETILGTNSYTDFLFDKSILYFDRYTNYT